MMLMTGALMTALAGLATPADVGDWWWVAGDSHDNAAVFVDESSARRSGDMASIQAVRIARDGEASIASWSGRCTDRHADDEIAAVARFACGTDEQRMQEAAILPGLTPAQAARAIFSVRSRSADQGRIRMSFVE